jgi:superfamily II DNA or RNA helicase
LYLEKTDLCRKYKVFMTDEEVVIVFSEHIAFGWKFSAFCVSPVSDGQRDIYGAPATGAGGEDTDVRRVIGFTEDMSDKALLKDYSRGNSVMEFLREASKEVRERYIRPRIEALNTRIAETVMQAGIPVYLRLDRGGKRLYEHDRIEFYPHPARCKFHFIKDNAGMRYCISLTAGGRSLSLQTRMGVTVAEKPCRIMTGKTIYYVEEIEARKLVPFFSKEAIPVPPQMEDAYLRTFVCKTMQDYETELRGIPVRELDPPKKAFLSLEKDLDLHEFLLLSFAYGSSARISPGSPTLRYASAESFGGSTVLCRFDRDLEWEKGMAAILAGGGLVASGDSRFYTLQRKPYELVEWMNRNPALLSGFTVEMNAGKAYHIAGSSLQSAVEMKIDWFEINIMVTAGAFTLPLTVFRHHILSGTREYLLPDGSIFVLPGEWFEQYRDLMLFAVSGRKNKDSMMLRTIHAAILDRALGESLDAANRSLVNNLLRVPAERPSLPLHAAGLLRPYQKEGFYWMHHLYRHKFGGCLADDMGLGKTIQTISLLEYIYRREGSEPVGLRLPPSLLVVPTSLLHNWKNELERFAPNLRSLMHIGPDRRNNLVRALENHDCEVIITSYGTLRNDIDLLSSNHYQMVALDESQYIKNPDSQIYRAVTRLSARHRMALTGTPLENSLEDLWAQFNFLNKGLLGTRKSFRDMFIRPSKDQSDERETLLKRTIAPFILRRTKEEVTPELPPLIEEVVYCDMSDAQSEAYNAEKNRIRSQILDAMTNPGRMLNKIAALDAMHRLRQLANHPLLILPDYSEDSGKFEQILLSFESVRNSGHKALFFSSYVKYLDLLAGHFDKAGWRYSMLTGRTVRREEAIKQFTDNDDVCCFLISLKAGSTGLNLTAADYVFILDPWWNPAAEMQALSRAHRIGQDKTVMSFRFISTDTIEEKMLQLQQSKSTLYETFVSANNPLDQFTWEDFEKLIK